MALVVTGQGTINYGDSLATIRKQPKIKRHRKPVPIDDMTPDQLLGESVTVTIYSVVFAFFVGVIWFVMSLNSYTGSLQSVQ